MKDTLIQFPEINLMGIYVHTNNTSMMNPVPAKIGATIQNVFLKVPSKINIGNIQMKLTDL
jgi:hypothetical protein